MSKDFIFNLGGSSQNPNTQFSNGVEPNRSAYTDRLYQFEPQKHDDLCVKHFGNFGQDWDDRDPDSIEAFLRDYIDDETIILCKIAKGNDKQTGLPYWRLDYKQGNNDIR